MKIPENFKQKYNLIGDSYAPADVDAALSEVLAISAKLLKENSNLKAEVASLREELDGGRTEPTAVDLSGVADLILSLEHRLDDIKSTVNDTLCVANDAVIAARRAEEGSLEARSVSERAASAAEAARVAAENTRDIAEATRAAAENTRDAAEATRATAESTRDFAEATFYITRAVDDAVTALDAKLDGLNVADDDTPPPSIEELNTIAEEFADTDEVVDHDIEFDFHLAEVLAEVSADELNDEDGETDDDAGFVSFLLEDDVVDLHDLNITPAGQTNDEDEDEIAESFLIDEIDDSFGDDDGLDDENFN